MPSVYHYIDYREFLHDYYEEQKEASHTFSFQSFARRCGISSSGFLLHVIKGERNLTKPVMLNVAAGISLSEEETAYFDNIVGFDQAKTAEEKEWHYRRIVSLRPDIKVSKIKQEKYEFYRRWYHTVLRELLGIIDKDTRPSELAKLLIPSIPSSEVKKSIELLKSLELISENSKGKLEPTDRFLEGGGTRTRNLEIAGFQRKMVRLAEDAWDRFPEKEISMHTVTCSVSDRAFEKLVEEVRRFKKRVFTHIDTDEDTPKRVVNININLFPLTRQPSIKENPL